VQHPRAAGAGGDDDKSTATHFRHDAGMGFFAAGRFRFVICDARK